jgi:hypothetical protein
MIQNTISRMAVRIVKICVVERVQPQRLTSWYTSSWVEAPAACWALEPRRPVGVCLLTVRMKTYNKVWIQVSKRGITTTASV